MLRALLISGLLAGGTAGALVAQTAGSVSPEDVGGSLVGSLVGSLPAAGVLFWRLRQADETIAAKDAELKALYRLVLEGTERMAPVLSEATRTLADVRAGMEATIGRTSVTGGDMERVVRSLQHVVDELDRRTGT